jgi:putative restriction endonuclease
MSREAWTRVETLVAFDVYCRLPFGRLHARNPEIIRVAQYLDRTPSALAMKCCNLASFDAALRSRGVSGLSKASKLDMQIWREFEVDPEAISFEAEEAFAATTQRELQMATDVEWEDVQRLDKTAITKVRVNQRFFRSIILAGYNCQCAVCQIPFPDLLVASHIVPWSVNKAQRMNPRNGICLCSLHDKAYDQGFLRIERDYSISLHGDIVHAGHLPIVREAFLSFSGQSITLPERWHPDPQFLELHLSIVRDMPMAASATDVYDPRGS